PHVATGRSQFALTTVLPLPLGHSGPGANSRRAVASTWMLRATPRAEADRRATFRDTLRPVAARGALDKHLPEMQADPLTRNASRRLPTVVALRPVKSPIRVFLVLAPARMFLTPTLRAPVLRLFVADAARLVAVVGIRRCPLPQPTQQAAAA